MKISEIINNPQMLEEKFYDAIHEKDKKLAHLLAPYITDPWLLFHYANDIVKGKVCNEMEDIIAKDADSSFFYANEVLEAPFPKGEPVIATHDENSYLYAYFVLKKAFPLGEEAIIKGKDKLKDYMEFLEEKKQLENFIKRHPKITNNEYFNYLYEKILRKREQK